MDHVIYVLNDPRDGRTRYVGRTNNEASRKASHVSMRAQRGSRLAAWFDELQAEGACPDFEVVASITDQIVGVERLAHRIERQIIDILLDYGFDLLNDDKTTRVRMKAREGA